MKIPEYFRVVLRRNPHGANCLAYEPEPGFEDANDAPLALDKLAEEAAVVLEGEDEAALEELLRLNGSSSGARPKIVAQASAGKKKIIHGRQELQILPPSRIAQATSEGTSKVTSSERKPRVRMAP